MPSTEEFQDSPEVQGWNGLDLADVARDHLGSLRSKGGTPKQIEKQLLGTRWTSTLARVCRSWSMNHTQRTLKMNGLAWGYIQFRHDLGEDALSSGRILRWTEIIDAMSATVQSRSASTSAELNSAWGQK